MTTLSKFSCLACGNHSGFKSFQVREAMLGVNDDHKYGECNVCGSIQNLHPPDDLSRYYPTNYYSLTPKPENFLKRWLRTQRARHGLGEFNPMGAIGTAVLGTPYFVNWLMQAHAGRDAAILDVGCGSGALLSHLQACGFRNLTGIDPFLPHSSYQPGLRLLKLDLAEANDTFDFIMLHHSLEHVPQPLKTLQQVARLLTPNGICLVRTPVAGTWAWQNYGVNWVQLDAPRHLLIPSVAGMQSLAQGAGLSVQEIKFDSDLFQFVGSEKLKQGQGFYADVQALFSRQQLREFDQHARQLNIDHNGDQACFWLTVKATLQ